MFKQMLFFSYLFLCTLSLRCMDIDRGVARRGGEVCGWGGERSWHCRLITGPNQGNHPRHCSLGPGPKQTATDQPTGNFSIQGWIPQVHVKWVKINCPQPRTALLVFLMLSRSLSGQLPCQVLCAEHFTWHLLSGQQLPGLSAGRRRQCWAQRVWGWLQGPSGEIHLQPEDGHLGWENRMVHASRRDENK